MTVYLIINILIIIFPLIFSFEKKIFFFRKLPDLFISVTAVGAVFLLWDSVAVKRGDWSFNPEYVTVLPFINLPFEELLFFITVPYSILFIYECVLLYSRNNQAAVNHNFLILPTILFALTGLLFYEKNYTFTVLMYASALLLIIIVFRLNFILYKSFYLTVLISFIPFLAVNYFLTSLPVVIYNSSEITGVKFISIPAEDFLYSTSMIASWIAVYRLSKERRVISYKTV